MALTDCVSLFLGSRSRLISLDLIVVLSRGTAIAGYTRRSTLGAKGLPDEELISRTSASLLASDK
ncbi:hypothetical protein N7539_004040 [Penicillium diatomitis]|uniref:Uncharacterized protein n=1 Tax=Penicillium diatomitis TaxID=2819901 RepID=A0A9W9XD17_9EURO|nr:uncharacterized protein N7539_004040 [Penicillium diatomitis]KAJ5489150.1 hypothetical protein N7539_004040 [Penicillium diatomitis]